MLAMVLLWEYTVITVRSHDDKRIRNIITKKLLVHIKITSDNNTSL